MLTLRFDMRSSGAVADLPALYGAAVEMCAWAETRGAVSVILSEHHGADDNHLPSPLVLASAVAARTSRISIMLAAVVLPLYEPIRLAEDMCVLDHISAGRIAYVFGIGHRAEEYDHFGVAYAERGRLADQKLDKLIGLLKGAATGGTRISPPPLRPGGPAIFIAGGSLAAVRRAGRHGLGFLAQMNKPGLKEAYEAACRANGHEPGVARFPDPSGMTTVFVARDVERAWAELGPYMLRDAEMAAAYRHGDDSVASITRARTVAELREDGGPYRILSHDEAVGLLRGGAVLPLHPLCGGVPPDLAWPYLQDASAAFAEAGQARTQPGHHTPLS